MTEGSQGARAGVDPIRVLIADDHALFRRGLEMVLKEEPGIELVGQASDGAEAVQMAGEALPDVVLMDIRMLKITGAQLDTGFPLMFPPAAPEIFFYGMSATWHYGGVRR